MSSESLEVVLGPPQVELERPLESGQLDVSVVIPCLNEEPTIGHCIRRAWAAIQDEELIGEVIVVDNGSTDRSAAIAEAAGATVVHESQRGYGSAYLAGLRASKGRAVLLGDGDATYDFAELPKMLELVDGGADLVLGSRLRGTILPGAMPWHHRWIGNPLLTGFLNLLFRTGVSDAHCGLRMFRRSAMSALDLRTTGMEFASEMVVKAKLQRLRIVEVPITYSPRPSGSVSKLNSIRDGLRHLRYLLAWAPVSVIAVVVGALVLAGVGLLTAPGQALDIEGGVLLGIAALAAQGFVWLRLYRDMAIERRLPAWSPSRRLLSRGHLAALALGGALSATVAAAIAWETPRFRVATPDGRTVLVLLVASVASLCAVLVGLRLRRVTASVPSKT